MNGKLSKMKQGEVVLTGAKDEKTVVIIRIGVEQKK